jgi:hypothetical protein
MDIPGPKLALAGLFQMTSMDRLNPTKFRWTGVQAPRRLGVQGISTYATWTSNVPLVLGAKGRSHNEVMVIESNQLSNPLTN